MKSGKYRYLNVAWYFFFINLFKNSLRNEINGGGINYSESTADNNPINQDTQLDDHQRWWEDLKEITRDFDINLSGKLLVLDKIIKYCSHIGDKL